MADEETAVQEEQQDQQSGNQVQLEGKAAEFVDWIESISVLELSQVVKALEERLGVSASAPVAAAAPAGGGGEGGGGQAEEEQTEFDVILSDAGDQKIQVIKELRGLTSLGLKEAKALVEELPKSIKEGVDKKEADDMKAKLEEAGASVEIK